ncbi:MAG: 50S ribosomal protein L23 [Saprospiraceae bacterium]|jgi:large subunit ribosomal protein L23
MKQIIIKPIISEKTTQGADTLNKYAFVVAKDVNKIEIGKAIAAYYNVQVLEINTAIMPAKAKSRMTKTAVVKGRKSSYKKAIVTLAEGDSIDVFPSVEDGDNA